MRRRIAMLAAVTAVSGMMTMFSPTPSATAAVHNACVGLLGSETLSSPLTYPVSASVAGTTVTARVLHPHSATFTLSFSPAFSVCLLGGTLHATGTIHGWCGLSTGTGVTNAGNRFSFLEVGAMRLFTGDMAAATYVWPNIPAGESCITGADNFLMSGGGPLWSCTTKVKTSQSVNIPPGFSGSVSVGSLHVSGHFSSGGSLHAPVKICIP